MIFFKSAFTFSFCLIGFLGTALAQSKPSPKREFRGVWIATIGNIDWPTEPRSDADKQKQDLINMLDAQQKNGINAVIFQVRPAADAFYLKSREPWSQWLTGLQGKAPTPLYDPLEFAITQAHQRGMELHAWFNPYRATTSLNEYNLSPNHITRLKPDWFITYGGTKLFNPGLPDVREYIVKVILDVVDNYDVDGIHMDDYFYPYQIAGQKIKDSAAFEKYSAGFTNIEDWRRNNVDLLIKMLTDSIHKHKPYMKFGISPFGIWKNKSQDQAGSETHGGDSFYELYADSRKWIKSGWIDYITPQIYWTFGDARAPFDKLVDWWSNNTFDRHLYIGQAAYRVNEAKKYSKFKLPTQIPDQIKYIRNNPRVQGSIYFSSISLINNKLGVADSLKNNYYKYSALPPAMIWLDSIAPYQPQKLDVKIQKKSILLSWNPPVPSKDGEAVYGYVIYRFGADEKINVDMPKNILHIEYSAKNHYEDNTVQNGKVYQYVVTAIDRLKNESYPSNVMMVSLQ